MNHQSAIYAIQIIALITLKSSFVKCGETLYMKRSEIEDQEASASAYSYQLHSGGPLNYNTPSALPPQGLTLNHFGYPPITLGRYTQELPPQLPLTTEYKPQTPPLNLVVPPSTVPLLNSYGYAAHPAAYAPLPPVKITSAPVLATAQSSEFSKGGGASYASDASRSSGEKGSSGYKSSEEYAKGAQGKHSNSDTKGHFAKAGGNKAAHHDSGSHYSQQEEAAKGSKGASFKESSGHKKGSKTTGYHRVHHKDEYKKDHSFYDESDTSGHFHKHGDFDSSNSAQSGGFKKGAREEGGYDVAQAGVKGFSDKGHYDQEERGYKGEQGEQAHHKDFNQFKKDGGQQAGKEYGYLEKDEDVLESQY